MAAVVRFSAKVMDTRPTWALYPSLLLIFLGMMILPIEMFKNVI